MNGPRRAPAPPLRLRLRSETAARRTISYEPKDRKPDGGWGHFKPSRWGQCKPSRPTVWRYDVLVQSAYGLLGVLACGVKKFDSSGWQWS